MNAPKPAPRILVAIFLVASTASLMSAQAPAPAATPERAPSAAAPRAPQVTSPEVLSDGRVVFRILAPNAESVGLRAGDIPGIGGESAPSFAKNEDGVWEATVGPIDPGAYRYTFNVDGVSVIDPRNPAVSGSNNNVWSFVYVPGAEFMDAGRVPHGAVAEVHYYSTALSRYRRMHVYTPPGYELGGDERYPLFYLLHGSGDNDDAWSSVGRAGFILDNLIAANEAKPMVVVMPAGHTSASRSRGGQGAAGQPQRDEFFEDFVNDIMPYVEKNYRVRTERANTAIAGLSMGGGQTLNVAFSHLNRFAYIGVYSSGASLGQGGDASSWEESHRADLENASLKEGTRLVWLKTGVDDRLMTRTRETVEMLRKHGFEPEFQESAGGHTWINWRNYLHEFAPLLFQ